MAFLTCLVLSVWLFALAVQDVHRGEVSNWLTVPPLLAVAVVRSLSGGWPLGLALALILMGAQWPWMVVPALAGLGLCLWWAVPAGLEVAVGVWALCFFLWRLGVIGGADAKVVMTLTGIFPESRLAWLLLAAWFVWSVGFLVLRLRGRALEGLAEAVGDLSRLQVSEERGTRCPMLPAVALGAFVYLWWSLVTV